MSGKFLSEADWKKFSRSSDYKDAALLKALATLDKVEDGAPEERLKALDEVWKQADSLLKVNKGDKALADYVGELGKETGKQRRQAEAASRQFEQADDEEASPELLTTRMLPLLRELRKGESRMHAVIALAGRQAALLIMRRPISPSRRKLLAEYLQASGGIRYLVGESLFQEKALTFVLKSPASGLAKRLKAAVLAQTGLRLKVRVIGEDGGVDEDGEADSENDRQEEGPSPPSRGSTASRPADRIEEAAHADGTDAARYQQRLQTLMPHLQRALARRDGDERRIRAVVELARDRANAGDPVSALRALEALETLLVGTAPMPSPREAAALASAAFKARLTALAPRIRAAIAAQGPADVDVRLTVGEAGASAARGDFVAATKLLDAVEGRLNGDPVPGGEVMSIWQDAKKTVDAQLSVLRRALLDDVDPDFARLADTGLLTLGADENVALMNALAGFRDAGAQRGAAAARPLIEAVRRYEALIASPVADLLDDNPFGIEVGFRRTLGSALASVASAAG